jgi:2-polyprenyl-3-methyl-5-hydroxy-6-metoxy-1,4-benzoquinol methylase
MLTEKTLAVNFKIPRSNMNNETQSSVAEDFGCDSLENSPIDASTLESIGSNYALSSILLSAVELNIFDCLIDAPKTCQQIATEIQVAVDGLERLAIALTAMDLLQCDREGNYHNTTVSNTWLTTTSPQSMTSALLFHKRCYDLFGNLTEVIKSGKQQIPQRAAAKALDRPQDYYTELASHSEEYFIFLEAMNHASIGIGTAMSRCVDFSKIHRVIDLGAGGGQISLELAAAVPHLTVQMVDLPIACEFLDRRIANNNLAHRIECLPGNILDEVTISIEPSDAVILAGVLADWGVNEGMQILHRARNLLKPGGLLLVSETLFNERKTGPLQPAILSLCMLLAMQGNNFTPSQLKSMLAEVGFVETRYYFKNETGVRDLIVAQKPI